MESASLNLELYHFKRTLGEITIIGTWLFDGEQNEPCLVLIRAGEERGDHTVPSIILLQHAYIFAPISGVGDPRTAARIVAQITQNLRMPFELRSMHKVTGVIQDHLDDLIRIPPPPRETKAPIADLLITDPNTGKSREIVLTDV